MSKQEKVFTTVLIFVGNEKGFENSLFTVQLLNVGEEIWLYLYHI